MRRAAAGLAILGASCSSSPVPAGTVERASCAVDEAHILTPDPGSPGEAYLCYGFSADAIRGRFVRGLVWDSPQSGGVIWHHATLYAVPSDFPDGPCDGMPPGAVGLHVWAPGGDNLILPDGVGLQLPAETKRLVVEMHVLRTNSTTAESGSVGLCLDHQPVTDPAMFFAALAPVPAIRPHMIETSMARCSFHGDAHLWSIWPHMHQVGSAIQATLARANGEATVLSHVEPWDFHHQRTYPLNVDVHAGDAIEAMCTWNNVSDQYVLPGPKTTDEMCNHGFIGWPALSLPCDESP
jgi:Copper type II ascorbate-dependent monooxygenase, C-terminal domain